MLDLVIEILGFSVCHQITARSFSIGGVILPVCARCFGIYTGFFISALLLFIFFRKKQGDLPPAYILIILVAFFLSTVFDGISSYLGLYQTNNNIRFITGFLCGTAIMIVIYPVFIFQYYKKPGNEKIFKRPVTFVTFLILIAVFIVITLLRLEFLKYVYYYLSAFSILFTFFFINLTMMYLIPSFSQRSGRLFSKYLVIPSILALVLMGIELFIAYKLHELTYML
ncbi:MAG: DUF2085 domain-containing protein [Actinobacteria bacterium]|nr:DUF2085 domain-containing protein [Actinomycetota bacterium]